MRQLVGNELESVSGGVSLLEIIVTWAAEKVIEGTFQYVTDVQPVDLADPAIPANVYGA